VDFLLHQNNLLILFVALASAVMLALPNLLKGGGKGVGISQAVQLANQKDALFIDIRSHEAFKAGAIAQSRNIPIADINNKLSSLPKDKPLIIVCERGREATRIAADLRKKGYEQAVVLEGGLQAWLQAGMPTSKKHH
jgi:rhodanese-related sulfurtransferase